MSWYILSRAKSEKTKKYRAGANWANVELSLSDVCGLKGGRELRLLLLLQERAQSPPPNLACAALFFFSRPTAMLEEDEEDLELLRQYEEKEGIHSAESE